MTRGLKFSLMDPTAVVHPTEPLLRNRLTSNGLSIWSPGDLVHLSQEAYRDLVPVIIEAHEGDWEDTASVSSGLGLGRASHGSGSLVYSMVLGKRKIPDAVVTAQRPDTSKRGRGMGPPVTAVWLRGMATVNRGICGWQGGKLARGAGGHGSRGRWLRAGQRGRGRWW
jgi:hypothetical protein